MGRLRVADEEIAVTTRLLVVLAVALALLTMAAAFATFPALAHGEWAWIERYTNAAGKSCCHPSDVAKLPPGVAASVEVGDEVIAKFPDGPDIVKVNKIYETEDRFEWVTKYGCLFRWSGG